MAHMCIMRGLWFRFAGGVYVFDVALSRSVITSSVHSVLASLTLFTMRARFDMLGFDAMCSDEQEPGRMCWGGAGWSPGV